MAPALEHGDRILIVRRWPARRLKKGDIVLVWPWHLPSSGPGPFGVIPYVKRVVGLPGETLVTTLDDLPIETRRRERPQHDADGQRRWHIPPGHVFVCGDNRQHSVDSRSWGPVPVRNILGLMVLKLPRNPASVGDRGGLLAGQRAPHFHAETLDGGTITLANYAERAATFIFFAPGELCRQELPGYNLLRPIAARAGVDLILVSVAPPDDTRAFIEGFQTTLPILVAPQRHNPFMRDYAVPGWPFYCAIDLQGRVQSSGHPSMRHPGWKSLIEAWAGVDM